MQTLKLSNDLFPSLVAGAKMATVRSGRRDIQLGELRFESTDPHEGKPLEYFVDVYEVRYKRLEELLDSEAEMDGAEHSDELVEALKRFYPDLGPQSEITVVMYDGLGQKYEPDA